ncbi:RNA exonuclease 1 homolog [Rhinoraja longicauda]
MSKAGSDHKRVQLGSNAKGGGTPLNLGLAEDSLAPINVKRPNQKTGPEDASQKLAMSVQKRGEAKGQSSFRPNALKLSGCAGQLSGTGSLSLEVGQKAFAEVRCNELETTTAPRTDKLGGSPDSGQARVRSPDQAGPFGNEACGGGLRTASWSDEESSLSSDDLNTTSLEDLELSDSDPMEECLRIFNEFSEQEVKVNKRDIEQTSVANTEVPVDDVGAQARQKKRIAHVAKFKGRSASNRVIVPRMLPAPKLRGQSRIKLVQQQAVQLMANVKGGQVYKATVSDCPAPKRSLLQSSKARTANSVKTVSRDSFRNTPGASPHSRVHGPLREGTIVRHTSKDGHDILSRHPAPVSQKANLKRRSRVSNNIRKQYLGFFIEEFLKTCSSRQEAVNKGVSEELSIFEHSTSRFVYLNAAVHSLKSLRSLAARQPVPSGAHGSGSIEKGHTYMELVLRKMTEDTRGRKC